MIDIQRNLMPVYGELRGFLKQSNAIQEHEIGIVEQFNSAVDELQSVTGEDYARFKVQIRTAHRTMPNRRYFHQNEYRTNVSGLVGRLHAKYFQDETDPLGTAPSTVISQQQHTQIQVQIAVEVTSAIEQALAKNPSEKEKSFLQAIKERLSTVKSAAGLIAMIATEAKAHGIGVDDLVKLFHH